MGRTADPHPTGLRERKKLQTRAAISEAADELFEAQGFAATTIPQIAERAQVSVSKSQPAMRHDQEELPIAQPGEASVDLQVEQAISVALMKATDGQWQVKFFAEETGKHNALSDSADFWIAIYPELDRLVANGCVERVIERRPPPDKDGGQIPTNCCVNSLVGDVLTVRVCSDEWMVRLTFRENDRMPAKQLFEKVLSAPASSKRKETR